MLSDKARIGIVFVAACAARVATGPALIIAGPVATRPARR